MNKSKKIKEKIAIVVKRGIVAAEEGSLLNRVVAGYTFTKLLKNLAIASAMERHESEKK